jgi:hypothetical protein
MGEQINLELKEVGCESVNCVRLVQVTVQWRVLVIL